MTTRELIDKAWRVSTGRVESTHQEALQLLFELAFQTLKLLDRAEAVRDPDQARVLAALVEAETEASRTHNVGGGPGVYVGPDPYAKTVAHKALHALAVERGWIKEGGDDR